MTETHSRRGQRSKAFVCCCSPIMASSHNSHQSPILKVLREWVLSRWVRMRLPWDAPSLIYIQIKANGCYMHPTRPCRLVWFGVRERGRGRGAWAASFEWIFRPFSVPLNGIFLINRFSNLIWNLVLFGDVWWISTNGQFTTIKQRAERAKISLTEFKALPARISTRFVAARRLFPRFPIPLYFLLNLITLEA